jgi:stage V sporulation protein SpoVS
MDRRRVTCIQQSPPSWHVRMHTRAHVSRNRHALLGAPHRTPHACLPWRPFCRLPPLPRSGGGAGQVPLPPDGGVAFVKVSATGNVKQVAGKISHTCREGDAPATLATGTTCINQAVKAICTARGEPAGKAGAAIRRQGRARVGG